jgi:hypothetical protein
MVTPLAGVWGGNMPAAIFNYENYFFGYTTSPHHPLPPSPPIYSLKHTTQSGEKYPDRNVIFAYLSTCFRKHKATNSARITCTKHLLKKWSDHSIGTED